MPEPDFIGETRWTRQDGHKFGITDEGNVFYHIPFAGRSDQALAFLAQNPPGSQCPEPGFSHLKLRAVPSPVDEGGARSTALFEYEGEDINGQFGTDEEYFEHHYNEEREVQLKPSTGYDAGVYAYASPVAVYTYTSASRRTNTKFSPDLADPEPHKLTSIVRPADPQNPNASPAESVVSDNENPDLDNEIYTVITRGEVLDAVRQSRGGSWSITELHTKLIEPAAGEDP